MQRQKLTRAALLLFLPALLSAQATEGMLRYTETIKMNIRLEGEDQRMLEHLPKTQDAPTVLFFNANASLYCDQKDAEQDTEINAEQDGAHMQIKVMRPDNQYYFDLEKGQRIERREFMGRFFRIEEEAGRLAWKLSSEQKTILGYPCQKATLQDSTRKVEAWFTPQIPLPFGPLGLGDLPGLILEAQLDGGERTAVATHMELKALPAGSVAKPGKGKSVTRAEFDKIVADKLREMNAEGGNGQVRMIIRN
jgi:GLPGLI family protein